MPLTRRVAGARCICQQSTGLAYVARGQAAVLRAGLHQADLD
jgi:hypothetical protein